jgi:hypothetical protein
LKAENDFPQIKELRRMAREYRRPFQPPCIHVQISVPSTSGPAFPDAMRGKEIKFYSGPNSTAAALTLDRTQTLGRHDVTGRNYDPPLIHLNAEQYNKIFPGATPLLTEAYITYSDPD